MRQDELAERLERDVAGPRVPAPGLEREVDSLEHLVRTDDDSVGALFVDESGELIGIACADEDKDRLELIAAYLPLYAQRLRSALEVVDGGAPRLFHIRRHDLDLHAAVLPDDYLVSLITGPQGRVAVTRRRLEVGARRLAREVLGA